jgi:hypothetical protein
MKHKHSCVLTGLLAALLATPLWAKLPAPSDEAKAKSAETAAKAAHAGKVDNYKLCLSMDRVAAGYQAAAKKAGKAASAPTETPACADPGPFVYTPAAAAPAAPAAVPAVAPAASAAPAAVAKK